MTRTFSGVLDRFSRFAGSPIVRHPGSSSRVLVLLALVLSGGCLLPLAQPLSSEKASDGSIALRAGYSEALERRDLATLAGLYDENPLADRAARPWNPATAVTADGVRVVRERQRTITSRELKGFLEHLVLGYDRVTRADLWFQSVEKRSACEQRVRCWVEINGVRGGSPRAYRGSWEWRLARTSAAVPWRIREHRLLDWELSEGTPIFVERAVELGLDMVHEVGVEHSLDAMIPETHSGGGVAIADYDHDGDLDLYVANGKRNRLYRNRGDASFEDVSEYAGVDADGITRGLAFVDFTGDELPDLYLANAYTPNRLLRNRGNGTFEDMTEESGAGSWRVTTSIATADVDLDGDLDIFAAVYRKPDVLWPNLDATNGDSNLLYINDGRGHFRDEAAQRKLHHTAWSLAASFCDYDADGDPDLFVANDFGRDHFYRNRGNGIFDEVGQRVGIYDRGFSMSTSWGDYDGDGDLDLYVSKMTSGTTWMFDDPRFPMTGVQRLLRKHVVAGLREVTAGSSLFENLGDGTFRDVSLARRVNLAHWAWGSLFIDFDRDGDLDLYSTNGFWSGESKEDT